MLVVLLTWDDEQGEAAVVDGREDQDADEAHDVHLVEDLQAVGNKFRFRF